MPRIRALDGLRTCAIAVVLLQHVGVRVGDGGWVGVDVFFVLSGFLITSLLLAEHDRLGRISLPRFYLRRAARLYPALLLMLVGGFLAAPLLSGDGTTAGYLHTAAVGASYTENLSIWLRHDPAGLLDHTWSLAQEEQFYLLWPPVLVLVLRAGGTVRRWALAGIVLCLVVLLLTRGELAPGGTPMAYFDPLTRSGELLAGCALADLVPRWRRVPSAWASGTAVAAGLLLLATMQVVGHRGPAAMRADYPVYLVVVAIESVLLVAGVVLSPQGWLSRLLSLAPMGWIGRISYGIYLYHVPIYLVGEHYLHLSASVLFVVLTPVTVLVAGVSFSLVELPVQRWAARRGAAVPAPAQAAGATPDTVVGQVPAARTPRGAARPPVRHLAARSARRRPMELAAGAASDPA